MKHPLVTGCMCGLVLLSLAGCSEDEPRAQSPRPVRTVIAETAVVGEQIIQTGEIQPHTETELGFRIDGRVASRAVDLGDTVKTGDLIATLNPQDVANEVRAAEADLESALSAETLAKSSMDRQRLLFDKHIVALAKMEEADANWRTSVARREAAQATLENVRNKLAYTKLFAPTDGIVSAIGANAGQVVSAGQMVVKLASTEARDAVFNVSEKVINTAPPDTGVEIELVSDPRIRQIGRVRDVSPTADAATRSYRVRVALPDAPAAMAFGATVTGRLILPGAALIELPATSVTSEAEKPAVLVVDPASHTLTRKPIEVARYSADKVFVASGLTIGDAVVTAGVSKLRPGQKVLFGAPAGKESAK